MTVNRARIIRNYTVSLMLLISGGCTVADLPERATVTVEATAPENLALVVSTRFRTVGNETVFNNADTIQVTGDYTQDFALNEEARISVVLINDGEIPEIVRMAVSVDGKVKFDQSGTLGAGESLPFTYRWTISDRGVG
ncbi:MAG: hypothetical protein MK237_02575 [Gemmatimonadetes bacterium]|nr:hypothetical protein [Gemmatimonadota bacterium]